MLPEPTLSLTLPSIHDSTTLDCRVFHPYSLSPSGKAPPWRKNAAVVAHPYAPLGGCYDDPIVDVVAATLLRLGFLVGTFNFRGASGSAGRTSWTSKPERSDYMTVTGFIAYYVHYLDPFHDVDPTAATEDLKVTATGTSPPTRIVQDQPPVLLLAGYSYGAMITTQLPSVSTILQHFAAPDTGSAAADVRLRAQHLAEMQNTVLGSARAATIDRASPRGVGLGVRIGGDEDSAHRKSHDSHRFSVDAEEKIRRGVADLMAKAKRGVSRSTSRSPRRKQNGEGNNVGCDCAADEHELEKGRPGGGNRKTTAEIARNLSAAEGLEISKVAYLIISPPLGLVTNLVTMTFSNPFSRKTKTAIQHTVSPLESAPSSPIKGSPAQIPDDSEEAEEKLVRNPTLSIYGDRDVFVTAKKLRQWASRLEASPGSRFRAHEVSTAGHFWIEERVLYVLQDAVKNFGERLLRGAAWDSREERS